MQYIKGYIFKNEEDAINAREKCDIFYGIPISSDDITQNWCEFIYNEMQDFYYIIFDESLLPILGQPEDIEIIQPPTPPIE